MNIDILFENENVLVVNKPAGLMVHSDGRKEEVTLVDWILENRPEIKGVGENLVLSTGTEIERPGIVHRLDQETSGALIIAKNQISFLNLKEQFKNHLLQKEYHAFVWGHFQEEKGLIDEPIGRNKNDFRLWHAGRGIRGLKRDAQTYYQVQKMFLDLHGEKFSFLHLFPKTGRTHQLRVHLKYLQRPIVSDPLYAANKPQALGFKRLALHAYSLIFQDLDSQKIEIVASYPVDFQKALSNIAESELL